MVKTQKIAEMDEKVAAKTHTAEFDRSAAKMMQQCEDDDLRILRPPADDIQLQVFNKVLKKLALRKVN